MTSRIPESCDEPAQEPYSSRITSIIMKNRFRKMIFLGVISFIIFSVILTTVLLIVFLPKSHSDSFETTTPSHSSSTTTNPFDRTDCSPNQNSTFYFAYSNDLTPDQVLNTSHTLITNFRNSYDIYSYARFDVNSNFIYSYYSSNFKAIEDGIKSDLPKATESYPSYYFGIAAEVRSTGSVTLPVFNAPLEGDYHICMTLQDHGGLGKFKMVHLKWNNRDSSSSGFLEETVESHAAIYGETTYIRKGPYTLDDVPYSMTLGFEYSDDEINILQIRIYSVRAVDFWVPYIN
ncbi:hypothetical protein GCK72_021681 [Caenorhabditis remanei]|uniref:DUF7154 domain-containing protein n=1 Tax=Caenorhabditis remanei TaxID=31234 RepID=A0A6A5GKR9_CAERE|nr:hypothetical protein GCK72_021681 [Caenorhabditis remanei]KAF1755112.1 hypothetical protein GCK72_021681 [Caenorhabditis remanei]